MRYHGNNIWSDEQTDGRMEQRDSVKTKHNVFTDSVW